MISALKKRHHVGPVLLLAVAALLGGCRNGSLGCQGEASVSPPSGGDAGTVDDATDGAFSLPVPDLSLEEERAFFKGRALFRDIWVAAPASTSSRDGLGPLFNARSCEGCHVRDGRGRPPVHEDEALTTMLIRLSIETPDGGTKPEPTYGGQFQPLAVPGVPAEGDVYVSYEERSGTFADGTSYSLREPTYEFRNLNYGPMHPKTMTSPRVAPPVIGLGLLDAVPEDVILAYADPEDEDGDGISGRANHPVNARTGERELGRYGWKANQPSIEQQVTGAFRGDIGITSSRFPAESCSESQTACAESASPDGPDLEPAILENVAFYSKTLGVPARRDTKDPAVRQGEALFEEIGCASCHRPTMTTGDSPDVPSLAKQTIHPYSDMLLHDMGKGLADERPDGEASGREWRTPPLWGIGLVAKVNEHTFFLHDGRARNLSEAILWHGGEAQAAQKGFKKLPKEKRKALLAFLKSL